MWKCLTFKLKKNHFLRTAKLISYCILLMMTISTRIIDFPMWPWQSVNLENIEIKKASFDPVDIVRL